MFDQVGLMRTQPVPLAAAEERAVRMGGGAIFGRCAASGVLAGSNAHRSV
jgi:hypothetical protein